MKILHIASEFFPYLKTGGLADVIGALPQAEADLSSDAKVRILLPGFPSILRGGKGFSEVITLNTFAGPMTLLLGKFGGLDVYVIKADHLYNREGNPYYNDQLENYPDSYLQFALLGWVGCELGTGFLDPNWKAEILHAHDWHAGLTCAYVRGKGSQARTVFTIHNLAYQGTFPSTIFKELELPSDFFGMLGLEFYGQVSYLKAGVYYADHVTTVSPTYALEMTTPQFGFGMEGLLAEKKRNGQLTGILNGVDEGVWHPLYDKLIAAPYSVENISGKAVCKMKLQEEMKLLVSPHRLLFGVISRFTEQKGLDRLLKLIPEIIKEDGQLVVLGSGDHWMQEAFFNASQVYRSQVAVFIGTNDLLAHKIMSGADIILVPSRFEPCGLTQMYGLKYGTIPLVSHTGGLVDTVFDTSLENTAAKKATGFVFDETKENINGSFKNAISRAFILWKSREKWKEVQYRAMNSSFTWKNAAQKYLDLYKSLF